MPLATILGVCVLLVSPPGGGASRPAYKVVAQSAPAAQASPQPDSSQPQATEQPQEEKSTQAPAQSRPTPAAKNEAEKQSSGTAAKKKVRRGTSKKPHPRKPKTATGDGPAKVVVPNGSTTDPKVQLAPGLSQQQASRQRHKINQLLAACTASLKKLSGRQLNPSQQDVVGQIRMYVEQARAALASGDLQRAENLATKANLLADNLAKH
jgi:hypothetical protein